MDYSYTRVTVTTKPDGVCTAISITCTIVLCIDRALKRDGYTETHWAMRQRLLE